MDTDKPKKFEDTLQTLGFYNKEIGKNLPPEYFKPTPTRLSYLGFFLLSNILIINYVLNNQVVWPLKLALGIVVGMFAAGLTFLAHETSHGAITNNKLVQKVVSFIGFAPFMISPTYWDFWHNRLHHGNTQLIYKDPDAFPTLGVYKRSKFMQAVYKLAPGSGYVRSYFYFFYWFSFQSFLNQISMRFGNKMWDSMDHKKVTYEFTFQIILVLLYFTFIGVENWIWLGVIPLAVQNYTVMSYISTNHNLSPLTKINDPLVNSVNVTNHPVLEWINLNFGYHVEHHIFPRMSGRYTKKVSEHIKKQFPDKYIIMPKSKALKLLYSTPRLYKNRTELVNPETGKVYKTVGV